MQAVTNWSSHLKIIMKNLDPLSAIHKIEVGPYHGFGYLSLISDPIILAKEAERKYCEFANFNNGSRLKIIIWRAKGVPQ